MTITANNCSTEITENRIDAAELTKHFNIDSQQGAVVTFSGYMREFSDATNNKLVLEAYRPLTDNALSKVASEARERFNLTNIHVVHRVGEMDPLDLIVWIGVGARHRTDAFAGCEYIIDVLKTQVPLWKRETDSQSSSWVKQRESDLNATARWLD